MKITGYFGHMYRTKFSTFYIDTNAQFLYNKIGQQNNIFCTKQKEANV